MSASRMLRAGALALAAAGIALFLTPLGASAQDTGPVSVLSTEVASEFPEGIRFKLQAQSDSDITSVAVKFRPFGPDAANVLAYLEYDSGPLVDAELLWRTNTSARYIPPGSLLQVRFVIEDADGHILETEPQEFVYHDARFEWDEVSEGPVTVAYHGPVETRAENMLATVLQTIETMGPLLGADVAVPIRLTMYNNNSEMLGSLPPRSATLGRELITQGRAFGTYNIVLVLGSGRLALGTAGHEVVHILVDRAGEGRLGSVPSWLNEGLAEFGNPEPGFAYDIALDFAIETDQILPVVYMQVMPGDPEQSIIFYGQARSIVSYMIYRYGPDRMRRLMAELRSGTNIDAALEQIYGRDRKGLDQEWREVIGAPEYVPTETQKRPTAEPLPTIQLYDIMPEIASSDDDEAVEAEATEEGLDEPSAADGAEDETAGPAAGGGCNAPANGASGMMDLSALALVTGLAALAVGRRILRR